MSLLLAIEPDRRQTSRLTALVRGTLQVELVVGETTEGAFEALGARVPDLVLTSMLLSPKDETALADRLRELDAAGKHVQTLVIPVLGTEDSGSGRSRGGGIFSRLRRATAKPATEGCDPAVFGSQITEYLERASAERAALAVAQADLDAAWAEEPPPLPPSLIAEPAITADDPIRDFETDTPIRESETSSSWSFEADAPASAIVEAPFVADTINEEPIAAAPDFTENLRAQLEPPTVETAIAYVSDQLSVPDYHAVSLPDDHIAALPAEFDPPSTLIAEPDPEPVIDVPPAPVYVAPAAPAPVMVLEEDWEEISLDVASDPESSGEIVSEVVDLDAFVRELHAVETGSDPQFVVVDDESVSAVLHTDTSDVMLSNATEAAPLSIELPRPRGLDLDAFAAELELSTVPPQPEPTPEPEPVPAPRPAPVQSGWQDVLSAIRRDIGQMRADEAQASPEVNRTPERSFEPLVFRSRPAPAAQALAEVEQFVGATEEPAVESFRATETTTPHVEVEVIDVPRLELPVFDVSAPVVQSGEARGPRHAQAISTPVAETPAMIIEVPRVIVDEVPAIALAPIVDTIMPMEEVAPAIEVQAPPEYIRQELPPLQQPSAMDVLSSLGLEPVDVLVPDSVATIPEPVFQLDPLVEPMEVLAPEPAPEHDSVIPEPPSRRAPKSKKKRRQEQPKAAAHGVDEWGFFDPQRVGFAALITKLNEIADRDERSALSRH